MPSRRLGDGLCVWRLGGESVASAVPEHLSEFLRTNLPIGANLRLRIVSHCRLKLQTLAPLTGDGAIWMVATCGHCVNFAMGSSEFRHG